MKNVWGAKFSPDDQRVLTVPSENDGMIQLRDAQTGTEIKTFVDEVV
jgi:WD40 repeat protein